MEGKIIKQGYVTKERSLVDVSGLASGIYLFSVDNETRNVSLKFVKE